MHGAQAYGTSLTFGFRVKDGGAGMKGSGIGCFRVWDVGRSASNEEPRVWDERLRVRDGG